jgi:hypothetical protein
MLVFFGSEGTALFRLKNSLLPIFLWYSKWRYRRLARQIAGQVEDYFSSGMTVIAIFGVDGSPSCGVHRTLDLKRSLDKIARLSNPASADDMNSIVRACVVGGRGLFIDLLRKEVERLRLKVPFLAHDLIAELRQRVTAGDPL